MEPLPLLIAVCAHYVTFYHEPRENRFVLASLPALLYAVYKAHYPLNLCDLLIFKITSAPVKPNSILKTKCFMFSTITKTLFLICFNLHAQSAQPICHRRTLNILTGPVHHRLFSPHDRKVMYVAR